MIRTILSPGVELNEIDKSQYDATTIDTYRVLLPGFSSKGLTKVPTALTSLVDFKTQFGTPSNEAERYAYNAASTIFNAGGTVVFGRMPYDDGDGYPTVTYTVSAEVDVPTDISALSATDTGITSVSTIKAADPVSEASPLTTLLSTATPANTFKLIDITSAPYKTYSGGSTVYDCLGIMPVVTTAVNAMAIASQINGVNMYSAATDTNALSAYQSISADAQYLSGGATAADITGVKWIVPLASTSATTTINSVAKNAAEFFPTVAYSSGSSTYDTSYFKYIGVVVYQIEIDSGTGQLLATPVEAFAGSLVPTAIDNVTNASVFIEDIINNSSKYIRMASKLDSTTFNNILWVEPTKPAILGKAASSAKKIKYTDLTNALDDILNAQSNVLSTTIDVVCDAGLSTIAQFVNQTAGSATEFNPASTDTLSTVNGNCANWRAIIEKFKGFCGSTRKDCVFITDSPRHFSLKGAYKRVDGTVASTTVDSTIVPDIKHISGINSSYGWGYAVWYKIADAYSGKTFWMPPSAYGAAAYISTRKNTSVWAAPAGITRGSISVSDTSFEPGLQARNALYSNAWNYSLTYTNQGTVLEGQKTFQVKTSAFDRINVRSLFLYLERDVITKSRNYVYEPNTYYTRQQFIDSITPTFAAVKAAGGMYDYIIIADDTINTDDTITNNEFRVKIGIKPTKTIEFIMIDFVAVRTGSMFTEV